MTAEPSPDLLEMIARLMRYARIGNVEQWERLTPACREEWIVSALSLLRLFKEHGLSLVYRGDAAAVAAPDVFRASVAGSDAVRVTRWTGDRAEMAREEGGVETLELSFTLPEALGSALLAYRGDPEAARTQGLGRQLSAVIFRLNGNRHGISA